MMGMLVANTGFEDIVYQSGVSINGVLAGAHYNRAWIVHSGTILLFKDSESYNTVYHYAVVTVN